MIIVDCWGKIATVECCFFFKFENWGTARHSSMRALMLNFSHQEWKKQNHIIFPQPPNLANFRNFPKNMQKKNHDENFWVDENFDVVEKIYHHINHTSRKVTTPTVCSHTCSLRVLSTFSNQSLKFETIIQMSAFANLDNFLDSEEADNGIRLGKARQLVCFIILYSTL